MRPGVCDNRYTRFDGSRFLLSYESKPRERSNSKKVSKSKVDLPRGSDP